MNLKAGETGSQLLGEKTAYVYIVCELITPVKGSYPELCKETPDHTKEHSRTCTIHTGQTRAHGMREDAGQPQK